MRTRLASQQWLYIIYRVRRVIRLTFYFNPPCARPPSVFWFLSLKRRITYLYWSQSSSQVFAGPAVEELVHKMADWEVRKFTSSFVKRKPKSRAWFVDWNIFIIFGYLGVVGAGVPGKPTKNWSQPFRSRMEMISWTGLLPPYLWIFVAIIFVSFTSSRLHLLPLGLQESCTITVESF